MGNFYKLRKTILYFSFFELKNNFIIQKSRKGKTERQFVAVDWVKIPQLSKCTNRLEEINRVRTNNIHERDRNEKYLQKIWENSKNYSDLDLVIDVFSDLYEFHLYYI